MAPTGSSCFIYAETYFSPCRQGIDRPPSDALPSKSLTTDRAHSPLLSEEGNVLTWVRDDAVLGPWCMPLMPMPGSTIFLVFVLGNSSMSATMLLALVIRAEAKSQSLTSGPDLTPLDHDLNNAIGCLKARVSIALPKNGSLLLFVHML